MVTSVSSTVLYPKNNWLELEALESGLELALSSGELMIRIFFDGEPSDEENDEPRFMVATDGAGN